MLHNEQLRRWDVPAGHRAGRWEAAGADQRGAEAFFDQVPGQLGAVTTGPFDADRTDWPVTSDLTDDGAVSRSGGQEYLVILVKELHGMLVTSTLLAPPSDSCTIA